MPADHRAADALKAGEARLRQLLESAVDLIYYCGPDGRFTYVNPTACRVMKYAEQELVGRHFLTLIRPDFAEQAKTVYSRQLAERTPNTYLEFPALAKDGGIVWVGQHVQLVIEHGEVTALQAIARDISKQKEAEERLRKSEARYRALIHDAPYAIYLTTLDGQIVDANPAFAKILGYESIEAAQTSDMRAVWAKPAERAAFIERYRRQNAETLSDEVEWRRKDGAVIVVRLTAHLIEADETGRKYFEGIAEDITAERALDEQVRQAQKMEAVGRLARGIAHDFNNVLAAILGNSDLIQLRLKPDDPLNADVQEIAKAAERGASLTRQLLVFSRRQAVEPEVLNLHAVVINFDTMLQRLSGDIELRLNTPGAPPFVKMEPGQIEQVVMNLVVNARDAISEGGTISVTADQTDVTGDAALRYAGIPEGTYARIAVRDTGIGIDADMQRHLFEPFFSTKDPAKGSGLGLSIVYGIAKEAGGTVTVSSAPGQGTTFEVLLPIAKADA